MQRPRGLLVDKDEVSPVRRRGVGIAGENLRLLERASGVTREALLLADAKRPATLP